jgi:hypothetical protein
MKKITGTHLGLFVILTYFVSQACLANEIYITQSGDNLNLEIQQHSTDNYVDLTSTGPNNVIIIRQGMHKDGTIDTDETGGHEAYWTVTGDGNTVASYQTDDNRGGGGGAPHHLANIVNGDYNTVEHTQRGKAGHDGFVEIQGDSNTVDLYQRGSRSQQWADIVLTGDDHTVDVDQQGTKSASAAIDLTNSGGAYNFTLTQNVTTASDSFSITGTCATLGGCSVTVNRNN